MKRGIIFFTTLAILMTSMISADIVFNQQLNSVYNLGDSIPVPVTVEGVNDISGTLQMNLICNNNAPINFYETGVNLNAGESKSYNDPLLVLISNIIGNQEGVCQIEATLGDESTLTNEFNISNVLLINGALGKAVFNPGEFVSISGNVTRETGENSSGFIEADIFSNNYIDQNLTQYGIVANGSFNMNISLPTNQESGNYTLVVDAYEKDSNEMITNNGTSSYNIYVNQVPTNLELVLGSNQVDPGESLTASTVLHDQTGNPIISTGNVTLKDSLGKIIEEEEINLGDGFEYTVPSNESPSNLTVYLDSGQLTAEDSFTINPKESVDVQVINRTIIITNTGNVPYNKTLLVTIGNTPLNLPINLGVGESKKYIASAPDGEYTVKIDTGDSNEFNQEMGLTGNAVDIKEAGTVSWWPVLWIVVILVLVIIVVLFFRKVYKKPFFGRIKHKKEKVQTQKMFSSKAKDNYKVLNQTGNKAELSLSIKGSKQDASIICIKIKDLGNIKHGKGSASESIKKIVDIAEENKAAVYENQDYLFLIFAPSNTKTFKNERTALDVAEKANNILIEHNKKFNQKMEFGISLNYGTIVAKVESNVFKFMSMGSIMTISKKIASLSRGEILLSDKINDSLRLQQVKTEKEMRDGTPVFVVTGIKKENEDAKKFIERFMNRQDKNNY